MGRILPGDITKPFKARKAELIGFRDSFATRVGERALGSLLTPQGVATGVKLVAPFVKMGGREEGLTESALGLSPAAEVAAKRVTPPAAPTTAGSAAVGPAQQQLPTTDVAQQAGSVTPAPVTVGGQRRYTAYNPRGLRTEGDVPDVMGLTSAEEEAMLRAEGEEELRQIIADTPDPEERRRLVRQFFESHFTGESLPQDYYLTDKEDVATDLDEMRQIIADTPDPQERARLLREFQGSFLPGPPEPPSKLKVLIDQVNETYRDQPTIRAKLVTDLVRADYKRRALRGSRGPAVRGLDTAESDRQRAQGIATDLEELEQIIADTPDPQERAKLLREFQGSFLPGPPEPAATLSPEELIEQINRQYKDNPTIRRKLVGDVVRGTLAGKPKADTSTAAAEKAISDINRSFKDNPTIRKRLVQGVVQRTLKGPLMGQIYSIQDGQAILDPRARAKIAEMAKRLGGDPVELLKALIPESKMNSTAVNKRSGASGLIQFTNVALNEMKRNNLIPKNLKLSDIRKMDALEQLDLAEKYFQMHSGKADYSQPGEFSVAIFGPAGLGKPRSTVLYGGKTKAYTQNREVDAKDPKKRKGYITVDDYLKFKDRFVKSFQKKAKLPVFTTETEELQKIDPIPGIAASTPEVVESGIEDQTAQVTVPDDIPDSSQGQARPVIRRAVREIDETLQAVDEQERRDQQQKRPPLVEMTPEQLSAVRRSGGAPGPAPSPVKAVGMEREARRKDALQEQEEKKKRSADSMLRSLAKVGSFRDQQRYIEGTLRRGDLDANQVQALTMAAGLIRDRMQPRTLAEALFAAERGTTVGDLWFDKTMRGVTGAKEQSSFTPYQQYQIGRDKDKDERAEEKENKKAFTGEVVDARNQVRRLRNNYNRMKADKRFEASILTGADSMLRTIGRYEAEMDKILRESRRREVDLEKLEKRFAKVNQGLTSATSQLTIKLGQSGNADAVEELFNSPIDEGQSNVDAARQAMGQ